MPEDAPYRPAFGYRGRHLQTLWGPLRRTWRRAAVHRARLGPPDGDFVDLAWLDGAPESGPLILILHGLEGSSRSHYARGLLRETARLGWRGAVLHFRSCSGEVNRLPRLYHSGDTRDLEWVVEGLRKRDALARIGLIGISLGGNVMLKWLWEQGEGAPDAVVGAVAISNPIYLTP